MFTYFGFDYIILSSNIENINNEEKDARDLSRLMMLDRLKKI